MKLANITTVYRSQLISDAYRKWLNVGDKVLDVGCGTGVVAFELQKKLGVKVDGCDIDQYLIVSIPYKKMEDFSRLPAGKKYDACMFNDMLHHTNYNNQETLLKQAMKMSRKVLLFELKPTLAGRFADYAINKIHNPNMDIPYTYRTPKEWKELFKSLGLKSKMVEVRQPLLYPFSHVAFLLSW